MRFAYMSIIPATVMAFAAVNAASPSGQTASHSHHTSTTAPAAQPSATGDAAAQKPQRLSAGYLPRGTAPDSLVFNPEPPSAGSAMMARDEEGARNAIAQRGTPRWEQAKIDADLFAPSTTDVFSCSVGFKISDQTTPKLNALLRKTAADFAMASYPTKRRYQRARPFMVNNEATCTPQDEGMLRQDGSYPSGHSAIGYGWGLVLSQVVPDRTAQLVARGRSFGDSRRVCNVHWLSDIEEGRVVATAVFARLQSDEAYRKDVAEAAQEITALRATTPSAPDCARENAALAPQSIPAASASK